MKIGKVNVDENGDLAQKYDVNTIPRVMMFKGSDQPVFVHVGVLNDAELTKQIQKHM